MQQSLRFKFKLKLNLSLFILTTAVMGGLLSLYTASQRTAAGKG